MSSDEPTGEPDPRPEDRRRAPENPWVAPSPRVDGSRGGGDDTPTSPDALPAANPEGAVPPASGTPTAAYPPPSGTPTAAYPPPSGTPTSAYPPPSGAPTEPDTPRSGTPAAAYPPPPAYPPPGPPAAVAPGSQAPSAGEQGGQQLPYGPPPSAPPPAGAGDAPTPGAKRGNPIGLVALILAVIAIVLAVLPIASFVAGLPALAAIVLGIIGLVLAGRRRGLATAGLLLGVVALLVAIAVSTVQVVGFVRDRVSDLPQASDFPSDFSSDLPSGLPSGGSGSSPGLAAGPHTVVYRITGSGTATITYSTVANGRSATARDTQVALPRERTQHVTVTDGGSQQFLLAAVTLDGTAKLACSISVDGVEVARNTSRSASGVELVTCIGHEGGF